MKRRWRVVTGNNDHGVRIHSIVDTKPKGEPLYYGDLHVGALARRVVRLLNEDDARKVDGELKRG